MTIDLLRCGAGRGERGVSFCPSAMNLPYLERRSCADICGCFGLAAFVIGTLQVFAVANLSAGAKAECIPPSSLRNQVIDQKLQKAQKEFFGRLLVTIRELANSGDVAILHAGGYGIRFESECAESSVPLRTLLPEIMKTLEEFLTSNGVRTRDEESLRNVKEKVLSEQARIAWEKAGIVDPRKVAEVAKAGGAAYAIFFEQEGLTVTNRSQTLELEAKILDSETGLKIATVRLEVDLPYSPP